MALKKVKDIANYINEQKRAKYGSPFSHQRRLMVHVLTRPPRCVAQRE
jgi:hypothetical protein